MVHGFSSCSSDSVSELCLKYQFSVNSQKQFITFRVFDEVWFVLQISSSCQYSESKELQVYI